MALGIAHYSAGQWSAAVTALQGFLQLKEGPWTRTRALLFMAMAQWQCGKRAEAQETYQQAIRLMESRFDARDALNCALRAEAEQVLAIRRDKSVPQAAEGAGKKR